MLLSTQKTKEDGNTLFVMCRKHEPIPTENKTRIEKINMGFIEAMEYKIPRACRKFLGMKHIPEYDHMEILIRMKGEVYRISIVLESGVYVHPIQYGLQIGNKPNEEPVNDDWFVISDPNTSEEDEEEEEKSRCSLLASLDPPANIDQFTDTKKPYSCIFKFQINQQQEDKLDELLNKLKGNPYSLNTLYYNVIVNKVLFFLPSRFRQKFMINDFDKGRKVLRWDCVSLIMRILKEIDILPKGTQILGLSGQQARWMLERMIDNQEIDNSSKISPNGIENDVTKMEEYTKQLDHFYKIETNRNTRINI